ncbi:dephospho-CoA kinase [Meiothermus ruber]|jgi:dephospho-CoA kinase|uniref:Dephospho-CoA kinase n=1 Tax=Meiothermus ruber (strain ATCC 35948 / DSM 1279 / VKM B-1258 / 21) TaxID=504728 RepID=D3PSB2_MEIRD|nr:dephospho-CoA kinase [Meiothermus ruber]ADD28345.1 dephospho-CoA kinase [Meiothermus ruber DSM 1279]AGK06215.1 dephospho-CoA kinase [Meiothermus ruber DSM 1279]MCL6529051.1 dephospho-CoA kinase [Meiothermus ruber]GAO75300.1 dephospho-CoA kinase [Meiothermus ruber H328]
MRLIGLTGSIGSGKSTVAQRLRALGVTVLDADEYAREGALVLKSEICQAFPEACAGGEVNRAALGRLVFSDPAARRRLEALLHPYVRRRMQEETEKARQAGHRLVVQDIPLLFEAGREADFAGVLVVAAPTALRKARVMARSGLSEAEFEARDRSQLPQEEKVRRATWVIWNDADLDTLHKRVEAWYREVAG